MTKYVIKRAINGYTLEIDYEIEESSDFKNETFVAQTLETYTNNDRYYTLKAFQDIIYELMDQMDIRYNKHERFNLVTNIRYRCPVCGYSDILDRDTPEFVKNGDPCPKCSRLIAPDAEDS